ANAKVRAAYQAFARLGQLQSMERPEFMGERSGNSDVLGDIELIAYQVPLQFDTGPALIKINLATDGKFYYIEHFSLQSEIFTDSASGN
ncbi:MAG: hypothetical protein OER87_17220, partial [Gammaproteobacteria bacterium]|nr:hypothetical protein [Gammaproteobacteria bacterium]